MRITKRKREYACLTPLIDKGTELPWLMELVDLLQLPPVFSKKVEGLMVDFWKLKVGIRLDCYVISVQ